MNLFKTYLYLVFLSVIFSGIVIPILGLKLSIHTVTAVFSLFLLSKCHLSKSEKEIVAINTLFVSTMLLVSLTFGHVESLMTYSILFFTAINAPILLKRTVKFKFKVAKMVLLIMPITLVYYFYGVNRWGTEVLGNTELWNQGGYPFRLTYGGVFAFQGFAQNPNISLYPFLIAFYIVYSTKKYTNKFWIDLVMIVAIAFLSNSRGNLLLTLMTVVSVINKKRMKLLLSSAIVLSLIFLNKIILLFSLYLVSMERKLDEKFAGRFNKWEEGLEIFGDFFFTGSGLNGPRNLLGKGLENGYLEFVASFGIIGILFAFLFINFQLKSFNLKSILLIFMINIFNSFFVWHLNYLIYNNVEEKS